MSKDNKKEYKPTYVLSVNEVDVDKIAFNPTWVKSTDPDHENDGLACPFFYVGDKGPGYIRVKTPAMTVGFGFSVFKKTDTEDKMSIALIDKNVSLVDRNVDDKDRVYAVKEGLNPKDLACANKVLDLYNLLHKISKKAYDHSAIGKDRQGLKTLEVTFKYMVTSYQDKDKRYPPRDQLQLKVNSWGEEDVGNGEKKKVFGADAITTNFFEMINGDKNNFRVLQWGEAKQLFSPGAVVTANFAFNRIYAGNKVSIVMRVTDIMLWQRAIKRVKEIKPTVDEDLVLPTPEVAAAEEEHNEDEDAAMAAAMDNFEADVALAAAAEKRVKMTEGGGEE